METDTTALLNDVPENLSDLVPYRCPKCGHLRKFATLRELRLHLQKDHAFQMGFIKPQPPHHQSRTNVFQGDTSKQSNMKQHNIFRSKETGRKNSTGFTSRSMSTLSSYGSNQNQEYGQNIREDSPLLDSYKTETEVLERELLMAKQSELRNKARSMTILTDSSGNEELEHTFTNNGNKDFKHTIKSHYGVNDVRSTFQTPNDSKQTIRSSVADVDIESRNYARALQNDLRGIWKDTDMLTNVKPPVRPITSPTGVDLKGKLEAMNSEVIKSRLNHWVTSDALYKSQDMLREMEHAVEEKCNEQKGIISNLLQEIQVKDHQLEETRKEHGKLNQERTRLFDETENLVREADTYNRKLQEELRRRGDVVETLNTELETLKSRSEQEIRSKESDLQNVKVKMNHLEWERDKMIGEMESLLQQAEQDGTVLRNTIHDKEKELDAVNTELNSLRWNQHQLLERTMEVYQKAEESQDMMKTVLVAKDDQLRSAMEQIERMKDMQKQLVQESRTMSDQAEENTISLKKLLQLKEDQVKEATHQLQFLRQEKASLEDSSASLAEKAETSMTAIENLRGVVRNKEKELQTAQGELQNLRTYLQSVAEKERVARAKLENFIEDLITRAEKAETELRTLRSQTSDPRVVPQPGDTYTRASKQTHKPVNRLTDVNASADEITERHSLPKSIPPPKPPRVRTSTLSKAVPTINDLPKGRDSLVIDQVHQAKQNKEAMQKENHQRPVRHSDTNDGHVLQKLLNYIHRPIDNYNSKLVNNSKSDHGNKPDINQHEGQNTLLQTNEVSQNRSVPFPKDHIPVSEPEYINMPRHTFEQYSLQTYDNNVTDINPIVLNTASHEQTLLNMNINRKQPYYEQTNTEKRYRPINKEIEIPRHYERYDDETDLVLRELNNMPLKRESLPPHKTLPSHYRGRHAQITDRNTQRPVKYTRDPYNYPFTDSHTEHYADKVDETIPRWRRSIPPVNTAYRGHNRRTRMQLEEDYQDYTTDESEYHPTGQRMHRTEYVASDRHLAARLKPRYYENEDGELVEVPRYRKRSDNYKKHSSRYAVRPNRYVDHGNYADEPEYYDDTYGRDQPRDYDDDVEVTDDAWDEDEFIYIPKHRPRPGTIGKARDSPSIMRPKKIKQRPIKKDKFQRFNSNYPTSHRSMTNLLAHSSEYTGQRDRRERSKRSRSLSPATKQTRQEPTLYKESRDRERHKDISRPTRKEQSMEIDEIETKSSENESGSDGNDGYVKLQEESVLKFEQNMDENGILWEDDTLPDVSDSEFDRVSPSGSEAITTKKACVIVTNPPDKIPKTEKNTSGCGNHSINSNGTKLPLDRSNGSEGPSSSNSSRVGRSILKTSDKRRKEATGMDMTDSPKQPLTSYTKNERKVNKDTPPSHKKISSGQNEVSARFRPINPEPKYSSSERDMTSGGKEVHMHMRRSPVVHIRGSPESLTPSNSIKDTLSKNSTDSLSLNSGNKHIRESLDEALKRISEKYKAKREQQNTNSDKGFESSSVEEKIKSISNKYAKRRQDIISGKGVSNQSTREQHRSDEINDFLKSRLLGDRSYSRPKTNRNTLDNKLNISKPRTIFSRTDLQPNEDVSKKDLCTVDILHNQLCLQQSQQRLSPRDLQTSERLHQEEASHPSPTGLAYPGAEQNMNYPNYPMYPHYMQHFHPGVPFTPSIAPRPPTYPKQDHDTATHFAYRFPYFHGYTPPPLTEVTPHTAYVGNSTTELRGTHISDVRVNPNATKSNTDDADVVSETYEKENSETSNRTPDTLFKNISPARSIMLEADNQQIRKTDIPLNEQIIPDYSKRKQEDNLLKKPLERDTSPGLETRENGDRNTTQSKDHLFKKTEKLNAESNAYSPRNSSPFIASVENSDLLPVTRNSTVEQTKPPLHKSKSICSEVNVKQRDFSEKAIIRDDTFYYDSDEEASIPDESVKQETMIMFSKQDEITTNENNVSEKEDFIPLVPEKENSVSYPNLNSETFNDNDYSDEEFEMIEDISNVEMQLNNSEPVSNIKDSFSLDDFRNQHVVEENNRSELVNLNDKPFTEEIDTQIESDMNSISEGFSMFAEPIFDDESVSNNDFTSNAQSLSDIHESISEAGALENDTDTEMARQTFYEKSEKIKSMIENSESDYSEVYKMKSSRNTMSSASSQASFDIPDKIPWSRREEVKRRRQALRCIFYFLDTATLCRAAQVCREWRIVARSPKLWQRVELRNEKISSKFLLHVARRCSQLKVLILEDLRPRNRKKTETLEEYQESIQCCLETGYEQVLKRSESTLHTVSIVNCGKLLSAKCLWAASCYSRMLRHVTYLSDFDPINAEVMWALGSGCRDLKTLQVHPLQACQRPGNFSTRCVQLIGKCFPDLKQLSIGNVDVDVKALVYIAKQCRKLKHLDLDHMALVPADVIKDMCEHGLKYLHSIRFNGTPVATDGLNILQENCHYLDRIYIQMNVNDYFTGTKQKENLKLYATEMDKLEALQKKPGLINLLKLKLSRVASTPSTEEAPVEEEENIVTGFFKKILPF